MREKGQTEVAKTLETPVFSRGIEILTEKIEFTITIVLENYRWQMRTVNTKHKILTLLW